MIYDRQTKTRINSNRSMITRYPNKFFKKATDRKVLSRDKIKKIKIMRIDNNTITKITFI